MRELEGPIDKFKGIHQNQPKNKINCIMSTIGAESSYLKIESSNIQNIMLSGDAFNAIQNTFCFQTVKIEADEIKMHINKSQAASNVYKLNITHLIFSKLLKYSNLLTTTVAYSDQQGLLSRSNVHFSPQ